MFFGWSEFINQESELKNGSPAVKRFARHCGDWGPSQETFKHIADITETSVNIQDNFYKEIFLI